MIYAPYTHDESVSLVILTLLVSSPGGQCGSLEGHHLSHRHISIHLMFYLQ